MMADELKEKKETAEFLRIIGAVAQSDQQQQLERKENTIRRRKEAEEVFLRYKRSLLLPATLEDTHKLFKGFRETVPNALGSGIKYGLVVGSAIGLTSALTGPRSLRLMSFKLFQTVLMSVFIGANFGLGIGILNGVQENYMDRRNA